MRPISSLVAITQTAVHAVASLTTVLPIYTSVPIYQEAARWTTAFSLKRCLIWSLPFVVQMTIQFARGGSGICSYPIIPSLPFVSSICHEKAGSAGRANFPGLMALQGQSVVDLMDDMLPDQGLALDLKKAQLAIDDAIGLVAASDLHCKDILGSKLRTVTVQARALGRALQRFDSSVGGAVDSLVNSRSFA